MNPEIEFSLMRSSATGIRPLLEQFGAEQNVHVRLRLLDWDSAWSDLIKVALYSDGPDISEIGTTWLGDLVAMNALYAFSEQDLESLGRGAEFLPSAWQTTRLFGHPQVWAIPWVTGARLLFFRRNLLEQAGIDEQVAFKTASDFDRSLKRLQACGIAVPWTIPTGQTHTTLHNVASWVWGAGGDFVSVDGKRTLFNRPEALSGLRAYFALGSYLAPTVRKLNALEPDDQFLQHADTALTLSGPWLFGAAGPELRKQLGIGLPPGPSFVGGSHLVIWKHTAKSQAALQLIRFLTQPTAQVTHSQNIGLLPSRLDALSEPPFSTNSPWATAIVGLQTGRSFPVTRSWGLMEDRLTTTLARLWAESLDNPELDLELAVAKRLEPLAQRLDLVLGQT